MSIEAMKQALEALELLRSGLIQMRRHSEEYGRAWAGAYVEEYQKLLSGSAGEQFRILNALQDRLADVGEAVVDGYQAIASLRQAIAEAEKQEPVAWVQDVEFEQLPEFAFSWVKTRLHDKPLYTHPPKREWVGLTEEEIFEAADLFGEFRYGDAQGHKRLAFAQAIEAELREKNGC